MTLLYKLNQNNITHRNLPQVQKYIYYCISYVPKTCFTLFKANKHSRAYLICSFRQSKGNVTLITFHSLLLYLHCKYSKTFELSLTQATANHVKLLIVY